MIRALRLLAPLAALLLVGAGKPLRIVFSPLTMAVTEGQTANFMLTKSGGNGRPSMVRVTASDGSYSASVLAGSVVSIPTKDDALVNGTRHVVITAVASTGAKATATLDVLDNDVAPAPAPPAATWTHCAWENGTCFVIGTANVRYGSGATWTAPRSVTGSIDCSNATWGDPLVGIGKECWTAGSVGSAPAPTPAPTPVPPPAPLPSPSTGTTLIDGGFAVAVADCPGLWNRNGVTSFAGVTKGHRYRVGFAVDGLLPPWLSPDRGSANGTAFNPIGVYAGDSAMVDPKCLAPTP